VSPRVSYSIGDLSAAAGVSRRTLHFYVQRRLLPPPLGRGRGARYTDEHLARLLEIKGWQEQGVPLDEILGRFEVASAGIGVAPGKWKVAARPLPSSAPAAVSSDAPGTRWFRQPLVAGFELHVAGGRQPLTARQLAILSRALGEILNDGGEEQ